LSQKRGSDGETPQGEQDGKGQETGTSPSQEDDRQDREAKADQRWKNPGLEGCRSRGGDLEGLLHFAVSTVYLDVHFPRTFHGERHADLVDSWLDLLGRDGTQTHRHA